MHPIIGLESGLFPDVCGVAPDAAQQYNRQSRAGRVTGRETTPQQQLIPYRGPAEIVIPIRTGLPAPPTIDVDLCTFKEELPTPTVQ